MGASFRKVFRVDRFHSLTTAQDVRGLRKGPSMRRKSEKLKVIGSAKKTESVARCVDSGVASESSRNETDGPKGGCSVSCLPEFAGMAKKIYELGGTVSDLAEAFNVSIETIDKWRKEQKDFVQACKQGAGKANSEVQRRVFKMAIGYEYVVEEVRFYQGRVHIVKYCKHVPADLRAAKVWLLNRYSKNWADKPEPEKEESDLALLLKQIQGSRAMPKNADGTVHVPKGFNDIDRKCRVRYCIASHRIAGS